MVVVLDPTLLGSEVADGLKPESKIVVNTTETAEAVKKKLGVMNETWVVDATGMALRIMGMNITNTVLLGAIVKASGVVKLESVLAVVKERFQGNVRDQNLEVVETAFKEAVKG